MSAPAVVFCLYHEDKYGDTHEGTCATLELAQALAQGQSEHTLVWTAKEAPTAGRLGQLMKDSKAVQAAQARYEALGPTWSADEPDGREHVATWTVRPEPVLVELPADLESWRTA